MGKTTSPTPVKQKAWPMESAGRHMTSAVPTAHPSQTLGEVQKNLHAMMKHIDSINYVYVIDEHRHFLGVLSIRELYWRSPKITIERIYKRNSVVSVKPTTDQEKVAYVALKNNIKAVPVVDSDRVFLGAVPSDAILTILYKEMHEDMLRRVGVHYGAPIDNVLEISIGRSLKHRVPWLIVGLLGGVVAAWVIGRFEGILEENLILAAFIPLVVYMSSAVGTQMEAFMIRDLAVTHHLPFVRYFLRQLLIVFCMALLFSALLFGVSALLYRDEAISTVLAVSLFAAILSSVFTGLVVPQLFSRMRMDPANASGPIATIMQDLLTIAIYFGVATMLL